MFQSTINPAEVEYALATTDGSGGITLTTNSPGITACAIVGDGSGGQVSFTLTARASALYVAVANVSGAAVTYGIAAQTKTTTLVTLEISDFATPSVVDPAMTALTIDLVILGAGV